MTRNSHTPAPFDQDDEPDDAAALKALGDAFEVPTEGGPAEAPAPAGGTVALFPGFGAAIEATSDPEAAQRSIVGRMLKATSLDQLFAVHEGKSSDQIVGQSYEILEVEWSSYTSSEANEEGEYKTVPLARVSATNLRTNEHEDWVSTAPNLTAFLYQAVAIGALPFKAKVTSSKSSRGYDVLRFERI